MNVTLHRNTNKIDKNEWNRINYKSELYNSYEWLNITENSNPPFHQKPIYQIITNNEKEYINTIVGYIIGENWRADPNQRIDYFLEEESIYYKKSSLLPSLNLGGWSCSNTGFAINENFSVQENEEIIKTALKEVGEFCKKNNLKTIVFKYVDANNKVLRKSLIENSYKEYKTSSRYEIQIKWENFDQYLKSLSSKRRSNVNADLRKIIENNIVFEYVKFDSKYVEILSKLTANTVNKNNGNASPEEFDRWFDYLSKESFLEKIIIFAKQKDEIMGFSLLIVWNNQLYVLYCGFDYDMKKEIPLYFSLVFYEPIRYAVNNKLSNISYSIKADTTKLLKGCTEFPQYTYIKEVQ